MSGKWMRVDDGTTRNWFAWEREGGEGTVEFEPRDKFAELHVVGNVAGDVGATLNPQIARELGETLIRWADECQQSS